MMTLEYSTAYKVWININSTELIELKQKLYKAAYRYASIRSKWQFLSTEDQKESDQERTAAHNHFIDCCNILSRQQLAIGENNQWRGELSQDRKLIGDLACYINCFIGIKNR